jgi:hypothetical protein
MRMAGGSRIVRNPPETRINVLHVQSRATAFLTNCVRWNPSGDACISLQVVPAPGARVSAQSVHPPLCCVQTSMIMPVHAPQAVQLLAVLVHGALDATRMAAWRFFGSE